MIEYVKILRDITARKASEDAVNKYAKNLEECKSHKETETDCQHKIRPFEQSFH